MIWTIIHTIDILLWLFVAGSVVYVAFFSLISLFHKIRDEKNALTPHHRFLILYPAYNEDSVILSSVQHFLSQDYPKELYHLVVISDHMKEETNAELRKLPIEVLTPTFHKSSKAKALQFAISHSEYQYDYVIILDADNIVEKTFLTQLNTQCHQGYKAIQCHRCAKNSDNGIAILDSVSEEINNTIFRKGHNAIGLSSALIGSGMCFDYEWFSAHVNQLTTAGEDRELEVMLIRDNIYIKYLESIRVYDEKVCNKENFQHQRLRWMSAQIQCLMAMLPFLPAALSSRNYNYIDKTVQQALIPRSILAVTLLCAAVFFTLLVPTWALKWWILLAVLYLSLYNATPKPLRTRAILSNLIHLPSLVWRMLANIKKIDKSNKDFIHTKHGQ
jgi:cellulose synthase/poly-beta-1,6-N-acetylglucosamine synthase-like glycosyltransferase